MKQATQSFLVPKIKEKINGESICLFRSPRRSARAYDGVFRLALKMAPALKYLYILHDQRQFFVLVIQFVKFIILLVV